MILIVRPPEIIIWDWNEAKFIDARSYVMNPALKGNISIERQVERENMIVRGKKNY